MLESSRLVLRRWKETDLTPFRELNADSRVMEFYPKTLSSDESDQIVTRAEQHFEKHHFGLFAVERKADHRFLGFVGMQNVPFEAHFTPAVEIGWRIASDCWGQGYATEAAIEVLRDGFSRLALPEIIAMTVPENLKSRRVMEKLQMIHDPVENFDNPRLPEQHKLRRHVLYRLKKHTTKLLSNE